MSRLIDVMHLGRDRVIGAYEVDGLVVDPGPASSLEARSGGGAGAARDGAGGMSGGGTIELPRVGDPGTGLGGAWRVIVLNDDHNTFDGVAHALSRVIPGVSLDQGYAIADRIHNTGRAIVWSGMREPAEHYWEQLKDAGLTMAPLEQG